MSDRRGNEKAFSSTDCVFVAVGTGASVAGAGVAVGAGASVAGTLEEMRFTAT